MFSINKKFILITVIFIAVVLFSLTLINTKKDIIIENNIEIEKEVIRHSLNGLEIEKDYSFFTIATMIDNSYDIRPQDGLKNAEIVYETLSEGNITRLLAIFDSNSRIDKIGPIRSARNYFMDWAEEYNGIYMHVGGSPQALNIIDTYNFINIDQIGGNEVYFWRDNNYLAPHNVFTSYSNYLRIGELKEVENLKDFKSWNFVDEDSIENIEDIIIDFSNDYYKVEWKYNNSLEKYYRYQGDEKFIYNTGEQTIADNIIIQVVNSYFIDELRRGMDNKEEGIVYIFNKLGKQKGIWKYTDNRTIFINEEGEELKLVPGKTWIEVIDKEEKLIY